MASWLYHFSLRRRIPLATAIVSVFFSSVIAADNDPVAKYIDDVKSGPAVYYTPEAAAYFATLGGYSVSGLSANKDAAIRVYMAAIKLGGMPLGLSREAMPVLIDIFPKAVHVVVIKQGRYAGEGTLEDCISTYVMSAKNQFMLSSPFLDYNLLSLCENFIDGKYETEMLSSRAGASGAVAEAVFNLRITFTFYAGECALSRITGMSLGHDPSAWRQWWLTSGAGGAPSVYPSPYTSASAYQAPGYTTPYSSTGTSAYPSAPVMAVPQKDYSDILVGGKYRIFLTTGDDLTGTVESRSDTSMVLETSDGKPYTFRYSLMQSYQLIQAPAPRPQAAAPTSSGAEIVSYDELRLRSGSNQSVEVKIANGSLFKGTLVGITDEGLRIDVEGSVIPIAKNVIKQIIALPPEDQAEVVVKKPRGPFDTLWIRNAQTDNYGKPKSDLLYVGTIIDEGDMYVSLKDARGGAPQKFTRSDISRYIRHSTGGSVDSITLYAKQLTCPSDMILINMPPGLAGKPFFKVCVDRYEYPNRSGNLPQTKVSFEDAKKFCAKQGKRLCTSEEWKWACSGKDGLLYPYGKTFEQDRCNGNVRQLEVSGGKINCVSPFGGFDMVGNLYEWVTDNGKPALMGGPFSKCQTVSPGENGDAKPQSGLRCCRSN